MIPPQNNLPQNRDLTRRFLAGQIGKPGGRPVGFRNRSRKAQPDGSELVDVILNVLRDENASNKERMNAATWLVDRGLGKPATDRYPDAPGIGDFTIMIGDHDAMGNPLIEA